MKKGIILALLAFLFVPAFSQDAKVISDILARERATEMDLSYLVAAQAGMDCSPFEAWSFCDRYGSFDRAGTAATPLTVETASHFLMNNYGLKGGLMWSAFHNPRYAWKELKTSGLWKTGTDPDMTLSGRDLVRAVSRFFLMYPEAKLRVQPLIEASPQYLKALLDAEENKK